MGGKKKLTLKQLERMHGRKDEGKAKKEKGPREKKSPGIIPPDSRNEKIIEELKGTRVLTPYAVSSRFNIRISIAKDLLDKLEEQGLIELISGYHRLKIYKVLS